MVILHICAGWQQWNGAANIARLIAKEQEEAGNKVTLATWAYIRQLRSADEVWIHCGWLPCLWWAAIWGKNVHWMPEACYDPVRLKFHGWKKWLVGPIERFCLRRAKVLVATCEAEKGWIQSYLGRHCPQVEVTDIKRFFSLKFDVESSKSGCQGRELSDCQIDGLSDCCSCAGGVTVQSDNQTISQSDNEAGHSNTQTLKHSNNEPLHLLYLGRRHPLKGLEYLEEAVRSLKLEVQSSKSDCRGGGLPNSQLTTHNLQLKIVSSAFGDDKEKIWSWCDVLVLPTLSDNFGLVVAEALERGKRVITTDGAPAWGDGNTYGGRLVYLQGFRDGTPDVRVRLLRDAIERMLGHSC